MELDQPSSTSVLTDERVDPDEPRGAAPIDDGHLIGGVCVLIADRLGLDVLWVRIAFVVMGLTGGIGVLVYAGLWLTLVAAPNSGWRWVRIAGGAVMIGLIPLLLQAGSLEFMTGPMAVVLLLLGLMLALWNPRRSAPRPTPAIRPATVWSSPIAAADVDVVASEPAPPRQARPPRQRSLLGRATLGVALMVAAAGALIDLSTGHRLHPEQWLGAAGVVCGIGLLVGIVRGRARWLVLPALAFALVGFGAGELARMGIDLEHAAGNPNVYVGESSFGSHRARTGVGTIYVQIDSVPAEPVTVDARVGGGRVQIDVADDVTVLVRARLDNGSLLSDGSVVSEGSGEVTVGPDGDPDVVVVAWVGHGDVDVYRYSSAPITVPPVAQPTVPALPDFPDVGALTVVNDWVSATPDGWIVLGGGEAVIDNDDQVVSGDFVDAGATSPSQAEVTTIVTSFGEYRLLPRGLLVMPDGAVLDLHAVRDEIAPPDESDASDPPDPADPADPVPATLPSSPSTIGGQP